MMKENLSWCRQHAKVILIALVGLILFILFESRQQLFYVQNFNNGVAPVVTFWDILLQGLYRWLVWLTLAIPLTLLFLRYRITQISLHTLLRSFAILLGFNVANLLVLTLLFAARSSLALDELVETFGFYFFHKTPIIMGAGAFWVLMVHYLKKREELQLSIQELGSLRYSNEQLYQEESRGLADQEMVIQVKVGSRIRLVPVQSIRWIEADDYCVKIHDVAGNQYTVRSSMKAFEQRMPTAQFSRVHRKAIVNLHRVQEISLQAGPALLLDDGTHIPVAQARLRALKQTMSAG